MNLKKIGKVFTRKFVGTGSSSYKKIICRIAVSQRLRNTGLVSMLSKLRKGVLHQNVCFHHRKCDNLLIEGVF